MSLKNKTIIVTGGSRGIGKAIVNLLAENGANIVFTYINDEKGALMLAQSHLSTSAKVDCRWVDIKDDRAVKRFIKEVVEQYGGIDVIVNNAGIRKDKTLLFMEKEDWDHVIATNLSGLFHVANAAAPYLLKQKKGRIINISSISGINGLSGQVNYSSSKAGVIGFTKALAKELAGYGITVNGIAPGAVETDRLNGLPKESVNRLLSNVPMKRSCTPEEVAMVVHFLADEELSPQYLTGHVITLDGGMGL